MSCPSVQGWISGIRDHGVKLNTELTFSDPEPRERRRQAITGRVVTVTRDNRRSSVRGLLLRSKPVSTFQISDVKPARDLRRVIDPRAAIASLAGGPIEAWSSPDWPLVEATAALRRCREGADGKLITNVPCHPFVGAVHVAFDEHRPLELSPDAVWLCIAQGFAVHVQQQAEALRDRFVSFSGRSTLIVQRDDFVKGSPENDWPSVFASFSRQIADLAGPLHGLVVADFSTTNAVARAASEVVLLAAASPYFRFEVYSGCGIPSLTLTGNADDWRRVRARATQLAPYEAGWWIDALLPVLDQFVAAAEGRVDRAFWASFYKYQGISGGPFVSGWINVLLPYIGLSRVPQHNPSTTTWNLAQGIKPQDIPAGLTSVPLLWRNVGDKLAMNLLAGFIGVGQDPSSLAVRPEIGWAVQPQPSTSL